MHLELRILFQRIRLVYLAILAAVVGALLVCLVVATAFVGALTAIDISRVVAVLFILSMFAMIACLGILLREVFVAVTESTTHHRLFFAKIDLGSRRRPAVRIRATRRRGRTRCRRGNAGLRPSAPRFRRRPRSAPRAAARW